MQSKKNVAIVVLNYLNYKDTIECVDSILMHNYSISGIVIVDNASSNESYRVLGKRYKSNSMIHVLKTRENLGYARGNNVGIDFARKSLGAEYVLVVNNDTIFTDSDYIDKLVAAHRKDVAIVGGKIITPDNKMDSVLYFELSVKCFIKTYIQRFLKIYFPNINLCLNNKGIKKRTLKAAALMFTPDYFKRYDGFYNKTFLYNEEIILYIMCERYAMKMKLVNDVSIYHKEDKSSELSFNNDSGIINCYILESYKYVIINYFINLFMRIWRR